MIGVTSINFKNLQNQKDTVYNQLEDSALHRIEIVCYLKQARLIPDRGFAFKAKVRYSFTPYFKFFLKQVAWPNPETKKQNLPDDQY
jgi:hypothetical protein